LFAAHHRPNHDIEITVEGGLEESSAADLLNRDESAAEVLDPPALGVVVLLRYLSRSR
jgi:hypothetical protein